MRITLRTVIGYSDEEEKLLNLVGIFCNSSTWSPKKVKFLFFSHDISNPCKVSDSSKRMTAIFPELFIRSDNRRRLPDMVTKIDWEYHSIYSMSFIVGSCLMRTARWNVTNLFANNIQTRAQWIDSRDSLRFEAYGDKKRQSYFRNAKFSGHPLIFYLSF